MPPTTRPRLFCIGKALATSHCSRAPLLTLHSPPLLAQMPPAAGSYPMPGQVPPMPMPPYGMPAYGNPYEALAYAMQAAAHQQAAAAAAAQQHQQQQQQQQQPAAAAAPAQQ